MHQAKDVFTNKGIDSYEMSKGQMDF